MNARSTNSRYEAKPQRVIGAITKKNMPFNLPQPIPQ